MRSEHNLEVFSKPYIFSLGLFWSIACSESCNNLRLAIFLPKLSIVICSFLLSTFYPVVKNFILYFCICQKTILCTKLYTIAFAPVRSVSSTTYVSITDTYLISGVFSYVIFTYWICFYRWRKDPIFTKCVLYTLLFYLWICWTQNNASCK